ncbi:MAG: hypothetical protein MPJ22_07930, partial [Pirellulales bacterium]|nr:hypothetical protein [Pirellulales bacterium]
MTSNLSPLRIPGWRVPLTQASAVERDASSRFGSTTPHGCRSSKSIYLRGSGDRSLRICGKPVMRSDRSTRCELNLHEELPTPTGQV